MTYLASAASTLYSAVQLWTGRANNAWGTSRSWSVGASFESDAATWQSRANTAYTGGVWGSGVTWSSQANYYYGASRVWGSGNSFETDLANMTADRNNWQSASGTWQSRANTSWGPSRVWSSGTSWETLAGAAVPPAGSGSTPIVKTATATFTGPSQSMSVTLDRTGYWALVVTPSSVPWGRTSFRESGGGVSQFSWTLSWPGSSTSATQPYICEGSGGSGGAAIPFGIPPVAGVIGAGTATFSVTAWFALTSMSMPLRLTAYFIPTPTYPA